MTPSAFLQTANERGIVLRVKQSPDGPKIAARFPPGLNVPPTFTPYLAHHKADLLALLETPPVGVRSTWRETEPAPIADDITPLQTESESAASPRHAATDQAIHAAWTAARSGQSFPSFALSPGITIADPARWIILAADRATCQRCTLTELQRQDRHDAADRLEARLRQTAIDIETVAIFMCECLKGENQ